MTPVYPGLPLLGSLLEMRRDMLGTFERAAKLGDVVELKFPGRKAFLLAHPDHVHRVLVEEHKKYGKQTRGYKMLRMVLGQGLVTSEGELWKRQRRIAQPTFQHSRIFGFAEIMLEEVHKMLARWDQEQLPSRDVDVEMMRLTLSIVGRALLSTDLSDGSEAVGQAVATVLRQTVWRITHPLTFPLGVPTPSNRAFLSARSELDRLVFQIIRARREGKQPDKADLLSMFMEARDSETGEGMSDQQLRDEVMTMVLAGHETTANALNWSLYLLAQNPAVGEKLAAELAGIGDGRGPKTADLGALVYTEAVVKEAMRLFPPVWMVARSASEEDRIGDAIIPKGAMVFVPQWVIHRDPRFFQAPLEFRPERFIGEAGEAISRHAYYPFAAGPRVCIGNGFALMEAKLLLGAVWARYRFGLDPAHPVELEPTVTLRPKHGLVLSLSRLPVPAAA